MRIVPALAATLALAADAVGTILPGSGRAISNCYVVLNVEGTRAPTTSRLLTCEDGDATCDLDGQCNDQCLFGLSICINQPGQADCTPPSALTSVRARFKPARIQLRPPTVLQGNVCATLLPSEVAVKVRPNGRKAPGQGQASILAKAVAGTRPRVARDTYIVRCLPRVGPCPTTTSTSTTMIPSTTTTVPTTTTTSTIPTTSTTVPTVTTTSTLPTTSTTAPSTSTTSTLPTTSTTAPTTTTTTTIPTTSTTTTTTTSTTTTTLCPPGTFLFSVNSTIGDLFSPAVWLGGTVTQGFGPCRVMVQAPSGAVTLVGDAGDHWTITSFTGFSSCVFAGTCDPRGGTCTDCTGVDAPVVCPTMGSPSCTNDRPSCSSGRNGSALAFAHVQCIS